MRRRARNNEGTNEGWQTMQCLPISLVCTNTTEALLVHQSLVIHLTKTSSLNHSFVVDTHFGRLGNSLQSFGFDVRCLSFRSVGGRSLRPHVMKTCNSNVAYILATILPAHLTLASMCRGKEPLLNHACVSCADVIVAGPCMMQSKLNLASCAAFTEASFSSAFVDPRGSGRN